VFVPASPSAGEDEGWLLTIVHDGADGTSDLAVLDATAPAAGPVATVPLPQRVPVGFHGSWLPNRNGNGGGC
jgi:carotenoid cleavage dioxygenase